MTFRCNKSTCSDLQIKKCRRMFRKTASAPRFFHHSPNGPFFLGFSAVSPLKSFTFGAL